MVMNGWRRWCVVLVLFILGATAGSAAAETIELVTYYPAPSTPDMHTRSLTVGTQYATVTPNDGQAFIYDSVGIGAGFTAADPPSQRLEVIGNVLANAGGTALFMASRGDNVSYYNGLQLLTSNAVQWTIGSRPGSEHLQVYSDADSAVRLFIQQGTGNVGIGTTSPGNRLHVAIADPSTVLANNANQEGLRLQNTNAAVNDWSMISFYSSAGSISGAIGFQNTNPASSYGDMAFATRGTGGWGERMRIASGGNVGVGTTAPTGNPSPANGSNVGNMDANDVWLRGANRWASEPVNVGPAFVTSQPLIPPGNPAANTNIGWFEVDVSSYVPLNTRALIVYVVFSQSGLPNSTLSVDVQVSGPPGFFRIAQLSLLEPTRWVSTGSQAVFPIPSSRKFQCRVTGSAGGYASLYLQGYYAQ